jgi:hypothetical protein
VILVRKLTGQLLSALSIFVKKSAITVLRTCDKTKINIFCFKTNTSIVCLIGHLLIGQILRKLSAHLRFFKVKTLWFCVTWNKGIDNTTSCTNFGNFVSTARILRSSRLLRKFRNCRAIAQAVSRCFQPQRPGFKTGSSHVGFVVDKMALVQVFSEYFSFPCQSSFH